MVVLALQGCAANRPAPPAAPTASAAALGSADRPLTGRARRCAHGRIERFECAGVELLAYLPNGLLNGAAGEDMWGWTDSTTGREFILLAGGSAKTAVVEVTDPLNPQLLGFLQPGGSSVKVYQHYAFVTCENNPNCPGLRVFDLTQLRDVKHPPVEFAMAVQNDSLFLGLHTMALNPSTGFLYGNGGGGNPRCTNTVHMVDVRAPTRPVFAGCYIEPGIGYATSPGETHDSECVLYHGPDRKYQGREICLVAGAKGGVAVADVTDKQHPKTLSIIRYPDLAYAHQGWFSADQRYFYLDDEFDEGNDLDRLCPAGASTRACRDSVKAGTRAPDWGSRTRIFDLVDLDEPVVLPDFVNRASRAVDHNLYIQGRYMYQGNYGAGLRIIDIAEPTHPKEVGYLAQIGAAWGTYPFLKKGVVAVSTEQGLFLARLRSR